MAKRRTAKQKAATRKLVALNRRRNRSTRKGGVRKTARRAYMGIRKSTVKKVALGLGGAAMASAVVAAVAPQFSRVAAPAGAYFLGGIEGVIGNFAFDFLKGRTGGGTAANASPAMEVL